MTTAPLLLTLLDASGRSDSGFEVNDRDHALQAATRAERAGADIEVVVAALFHDAAKAVDNQLHGALMAGLLAPHVRSDVEFALRVHQDFTARHLRNGRVRHRRLVHRAHPGYALAARFVDDWDAPSRDPNYHSEPLEHFCPMVDQVLMRRYPPRIPFVTRARAYALRKARRVGRGDTGPGPGRRPIGRSR